MTAGDEDKAIASETSAPLSPFQGIVRLPEKATGNLNLPFGLFGLR